MEGGRIALGGYFYQIVGLVGLLAKAQLTAVSQEAKDEFNVLMEYLHNGGRIQHEYLEEDGVIKQLGVDATDHFVLMQFKYSQQVPAPSLGSAELEDICDRFRVRATHIEQHGGHVDRCVLITNRHIASDERKPGDPLERPITEHLWLRAITRIPEDDWKQGVQRFGWKYGCFEEEIQKGFHEFVGKLTDDAAHGRTEEYTHEDLVRALTGFDAQPVAPPHVILKEAPHLDRFFSRLDLPGQPLRRAIVDDLDNAARRRALILLEGSGGVGKSVALGQWMQGLCERMQRGESYGALRRMQEVEPNYFACILREWAHDYYKSRGRCGEDPADFFHRLTQALYPKSAHPIFHLSLDGMDEGPIAMHPEAVYRLLNWFVEEDVKCQAGALPRATLIITCRELDRENPQHKVLTSALGTLALPSGHRFWSIKVDSFSTQELIPAAQHLQSEVGNQVEQLLRQSEMAAQSALSERGSVYAGVELGASSYVPAALPLRAPLIPLSEQQREVVEILCYPVFWRAFLDLTDHQEQILQGNVQALAALAEYYLEWFCRKAYVRGLPLQPPLLRRALQPLARYCQQSGDKVFEREAIAAHIQQARVAFPAELHLFYDEALSAGLFVQEQETSWRWRHAFLRDYLAG